MCGSNRMTIECTFNNDYDSIEEFTQEQLKGYDFADFGIVRPKWDKYFMQLAHLVSKRTNCMKRAVGCVIVKDCRVVATGYNGTPFGM